MKRRLDRYILMSGGIEIGRVPTVQDIADWLECSKQHIYVQMNESGTSTFKYKKVVYEIIDRLTLNNNED